MTPSPATDAEATPVEPGRGSILLVDDEPGFREIARYQLAAAGYDVTTAADGVEAIETLQPTSSRPLDLVISDVRMPRMDGLELLRWVRQHRPEVEVILLSAVIDVDQALQAVRDGAVDFMTKPVRRAELEARVHRCIQSARLRRENDRLRDQQGADPRP